jgi:hypothetical protein
MKMAAFIALQVRDKGKGIGASIAMVSKAISLFSEFETLKGPKF